MTAKPLTDEAALHRDARKLADALTLDLGTRGIEGGFDLLGAADVLQALGRAKLTLEPDRGRRLARRVIATRTDL